MTSASKAFWIPGYSIEIVVVHASHFLPLGVGISGSWLGVVGSSNIELHNLSPSR